MNSKKFTFYIILLSSLINFLIAFLSSAISVSLPVIANELYLSNIFQNWISTIYLLSIAIFSLPSGYFVAKYGIKKCSILGVVISIISCIGCALSFSGESLLFFRVIQGVGNALLNVTSTLFIVEFLPIEKRGKSLGLSIASVYIGLSLAPIIGGILTYRISWQSIFLFAIPFFMLILIILLIAIKKESSFNKNLDFDFKGSFIFAFGIIFFVYGFTVLNTFNGLIFTVIGLFLLALFVFIELKVKYPIFKIELFKSLNFSISIFTQLLSYIATFIIIFVLNYHFQYILGFNSQKAGLFLIITPIFQAIFAPISGRLSDNFNPLKIATLGLFFVVVSLAILSTLNEQTNLFLIIIAMVFEGIGLGLFSSPSVNTTMSSVNSEDTNYASAAVSITRTIGQTLSIGLFTVVFAFIMGDVVISSSNYNLLIISFQISCIICTILCFIGFISCIIGFNKNSS